MTAELTAPRLAKGGRAAVASLSSPPPPLSVCHVSIFLSPLGPLPPALRLRQRFASVRTARTDMQEGLS